jgi:hypothetical protein
MRSLFLFLTLATFSFATGHVNTDSRFKMYCMYTPQFKTLYEQYFLPSLKDDFEIVLKECEQECPSGIFKSAGWEKTMLRKLEMLLEAIDTHWNDRIFFYSDVDIIFLKPILETCLSYLGDHDFVVQQGWPRKGLCAGFFVMKGNEKTRKLITTAIHLLQSEMAPEDQAAIQIALDHTTPGEISWKFLPPKQFPNGKRVIRNYKQGLYSVDSEISLDESILLFHANCCIGLDNKYHFLNRVQDEYLKMWPSQ